MCTLSYISIFHGNEINLSFFLALQSFGLFEPLLRQTQAAVKNKRPCEEITELIDYQSKKQVKSSYSDNLSLGCTPNNYMDSDSDQSGVVSEYCEARNDQLVSDNDNMDNDTNFKLTSSTIPSVTRIIESTMQDRAEKPPISARIDLNTQENLTSISSDIKQIFLFNAITDDKQLTSISPGKMKREIDTLVGVVDDVEYRRNGSLLITCKDFNQVSTLLNLKATRLPLSQLPIKAAVSWSTQMVYGRLYAPEMKDDSLNPRLLPSRG